MTIQIRLISTKQSDENEDYTDENFRIMSPRETTDRIKLKIGSLLHWMSSKRGSPGTFSFAWINYQVMRSEDNTSDDINFDLEESTRALSCAHDVEAVL